MGNCHDGKKSEWEYVRVGNCRVINSPVEYCRVGNCHGGKMSGGKMSDIPGKHGNTKGNITIIESDKIFSEKKEVADKFNNFFIEAVENLEIEHFDNVGNITSTNEINSNYVIDEIDNIITKYSVHPSILKIKENVNPETRFQFKDMTSQEMEAEIRKLDPKKASVENDIPTKALKLSCDIVNANLSTIFNNSKNKERFPVPLKLADVTPIHKAKARTNLKNYRPVSVIPTVAKLFERNMYDQISTC